MRRFLIACVLAITTATMPALAATTSRITIDVRDASLQDVLSLLSEESGVNVALDASVGPRRVTLRLRNVTFDEALTAIVDSQQLQVRHEGSVLIVGTAESMNRRYGSTAEERGAQTIVLTLVHASPDDVAKELLPALPEGTVVLPDRRTGTIIVTGSTATVGRARVLVAALDAPAYGRTGGFARSYPLHYLKASDATKELKGMLPDGSYVADDAQNALLITGNDDVQLAAQRFLSSADIATPQVLFEVRVADVEPENDTSNVGVEFGGVDFSGTPTLGSGTYAFSRGSIGVNARVNALVTEGHAQILATPRLMTLNNKEADLLIGQTYPVVYYDARLGGQQVQFVEIGVKLRLTPTIGADGSVTAEMHPEYSAIEGFEGGYPVIANRKVDSTLRVRDNETIVLGGLLRDIDSDAVTKFPGLANVPVFGKVFQNRLHTRERDEIVFFITPHIVRPAAQR